MGLWGTDSVSPPLEICPVSTQWPRCFSHGRAAGTWAGEGLECKGQQVTREGAGPWTDGPLQSREGEAQSQPPDSQRPTLAPARLWDASAPGHILTCG